MEFVLLIVAIIAIAIGYALKEAKDRKKYSKMTDKELKALYKECVKDIADLVSGGSGLTGAFSTAATQSINNKIQDYKMKGQVIGEILVSRGYKVDFSLLEGTACKGKSALSKSVIGSAVVGGAIAGPTGAIVGAINAADKNNKTKD